MFFVSVSSFGSKLRDAGRFSRLIKTKMTKDVGPTRNSSSEFVTEDNNLTIDPLRISTFVYDHCERANGDKVWKQRLRDNLVFDWIRDQNRQYANITQESFRDFLLQNLRDFAETDLLSQLMNAYSKCMEKMILSKRQNKNNSGFRRRRRKREALRDGVQGDDGKFCDLHPCSSLGDDNELQTGLEDKAAQFNLNDLD